MIEIPENHNTCLNCGKSYYVLSCRKNISKYCSQKCMFEYRVNNKLYVGKKNPAYGLKRPDLVKINKSKEHRELVANFNTNIRKPRGYFSQEVLKILSIKISKRNRELGLFVKEKNPYWKGGVAEARKGVSLSKYNKFRKSVLERDGNKCLMCLSTNNLQVHHIIPFYEDKTKVYDVDNGITLCRKCHILTHLPEKNRRTKYNAYFKEYFVEFLSRCIYG